MHHVIEVSFVTLDNDNMGVKVEPNAFPGNLPQLKPGDIVTWKCAEPRDMHVLFQKVGVDLSHLDPCNPEGPFSSLTPGAGVVVGTVRSIEDINPSRLFVYKILEKDKELEWANPVAGAPDKVLGGTIMHPPTPP